MKYDLVLVSYTRHDAIKNGSLVDITDIAKELGIQYPVAITKAIWDRYINQEDTDVRLWVLLREFRFKSSIKGSSLMRFYVLFGSELICLWAVRSPGDEMELVVTIMLPCDY